MFVQKGTKMQSKITFPNEFGSTTSFSRSSNSIWLTQLWGLECGLNETDSGAAITRGLAVLDTADHRYEGDDFQLVDANANPQSLNLIWMIGKTGLSWKSFWHLHPQSGIWSRQDVLENNGAASVEIRRCLARFPFAAGQYEVYTQASNWAHENQGHWNEFFAGRLSLRSLSGRTTQIAAPYLFLRPKGSETGLAFHILPCGNWSIHLDRTSTTRDEHSSFTVIELGLSDNTLNLHLAPGTSIDLPEILIQDIPSSQPETGAAPLHRYVLEKYFSSSAIKPAAPVVYNTWFDAFENLDVNRLRAQLAAAKDIGCEVFTIDAGWYGTSQGNWHQQVGDWREKLDGAFHGQMAAFADEVRASGLKFGLWVEPERNSPQAPSVKSHPEWFLPSLGGFFYPDLTQPSAYTYLLAELSRLVETYQLAWMKVDFNFELGYAQDESYGYFQRWYQLMDELRAKYPHTFFEGCASGGMRLDLNTLRHFDGHFLSDTVNPIDVLRITQGAMLRLPPGRIARWAVLRPYEKQALTPGGGGWEDAVLADPDFVCRAAMPGMFGLSGDLAGLVPEIQTRLRQHVTFYKEWREFISGAACHLLTPIRPLDDRTGWVAFQLQNPRQPNKTLVFVYRLLDGVARRSFRLRDLDGDQTYAVTHDDASDSRQPVSAFELLSSGLTVDLPRPNSAAIFILRAE
jgi:alpha-galactosidase